MDPVTLGAANAAAKKMFLPRLGTTAKTRVLCIGSSNVEGWFASPQTTNCWVGKLASRLSATHTFFNAGIHSMTPAYWNTPDAMSNGYVYPADFIQPSFFTPDMPGYTPLEQLIVNTRPHIVMAVLAPKNMTGGPSNAYLGYVDFIRSVCNMNGIRAIFATPYMDESFTASQNDFVWQLGQVMRRRGISTVDWAGVWGYGTTIPGEIAYVRSDTGLPDGTHLTTLGHTELAGRVPSDFLSLTTALPPARLRLPQSGGVTIPAGASGAPFKTYSWPTRSWTISFWVKFPTTPKWVTGIFGTASTHNTRLRCATANQMDVASTAGITHPAQTVANGTEYHVALTYNAVTGNSVLYMNGVAVSTTTNPTGLTVNGITLGSTYSETGTTSVCDGYRFRSAAAYAMDLTAQGVAELYEGDGHTSSLYAAWPMTDGAGRQAGSILVSDYGSTRLAVGITIP